MYDNKVLEIRAKFESLSFCNKVNSWILSMKLRRAIAIEYLINMSLGMQTPNHLAMQQI